MNRFPDELFEMTKQFVFTGSSVICDPPVLDTDIDLVIYVADRKQASFDLSMMNFSRCSDYETGSGKFDAYRRDKLNLIVTDVRADFYAWYFATVEATKLNITAKQDRIAFFDIYRKYAPTVML